MKTICSIVVLTFLSLSSFGQKDPCDKHFFKQNKSKNKSEVFDKEKSLKTKYSSFFANGNRTVSIAFIQQGDKLFLQFHSMITTMDGDNLKREVILGQNIKIALIFEDGSNEIVSFSSNEQKSPFSSKTTMANQNQIVLSEELLDKLSKIKLVKSEFRNPFNQLNDSKVKAREVKGKVQEKIIMVANCFIARTASK